MNRAQAINPGNPINPANPGSIRVVVADDSPFICRLLTQYLESDPAIKVVKTALNGKDALDAVMTLKPNVVTLDLNMPVLSGLETLKHIMTECPTAVVLISGVTKESAKMTNSGLSLGAVDFILKYSPSAMMPPEMLRREIVARVKAASRVKVIRSIPSMDMRFGEGKKEYIHSVLITQPPSAHQPQQAAENVSPISKLGTSFSRVVVIGASTGGPLALKELLSSMKKGFTFPMVIVQHMPEGFTATLAAQFNRIFPFTVREAKHGDTLCPGMVFVAPGDRHLLVGDGGMLQVSTAPPINGQRPSIDVTMQSAAQVFGGKTIGVVLSGMGNDGSEGLLAIWNNCGATYAQSSETCVVDSMPLSAIKKGIVQHIGTPLEIGHWLEVIKN